MELYRPSGKHSSESTDKMILKFSKKYQAEDPRNRFILRAEDSPQQCWVYWRQPYSGWINSFNNYQPVRILYFTYRKYATKFNYGDAELMKNFVVNRYQIKHLIAFIKNLRKKNKRSQ